MFNIWVTDKCNLKCAYCYEKKKIREDYNIDVETLYEFIEKYNMREDVVINFHGGEPLLNFEAIKEISYTIKKKYPTAELSLTTNGTIINDEILDFLYDMQCEVSISIDGNAYAHDKYRIDKNGKGSHHLVMNTIMRIKRAGITNIRYRMTFNSHTVNELYDNIVWLYSHGVDNLVAVPDYFDMEWNEDSLNIYESTLYKLKQYMDEVETKQYYLSLLDKRKVNYKGYCNGGIGSYNIAVNGDVYPCTYTVGNSKYKIGNIKGGIDNKMVDNLKELCHQDISECIGCTYKSRCSAYRCRYVNEIIIDDICKVAPILCNFENIHYKFFIHS